MPDPSAQVDVGEEAPIHVSALGVEAEDHGAPANQPLVGLMRLATAALHRGVGLHGLRGVDADIADRLLVVAGHPDVDRVPVDDVGDSDRNRPSGFFRAAVGAAAATEREYDENSGNEEGATEGAPSQRSGHPSMMLGSSELLGGWRKRYGIRRTDPRFWETLDWLNEDLRRASPTEFGLYDLGRYGNL